MNTDRVDEAIYEANGLASKHLSMLCPMTALDVLEIVVDVVPMSEAKQHEDWFEMYLLFARALSQTNPRDARLQKTLAWLDSCRAGG